MEIDKTKFQPVIKPMRFQTIILPDESFFYDEVTNSRFFTNEYWKTIEQIRCFARKNFTPISQKKFYFFHGINQIGEERLANYFKSKGYEIIRPELLSLTEQLNIMANCESFISTLGSCAHNMIFMNDNSEVLFIPRSCYLTGYQDALNELYNLNISYIDSTFSIFQPANGGPFCYIISKQLKEYFGDEWNGEYKEEDFVIFLSYVKHSQSIGLKESEKAMEYYAPILPEFISQLKKREDLMKKIGVKIN